MYIVQSMVFALHVYEIIILCACKVSILHGSSEVLEQPP